MSKTGLGRKALISAGWSSSAAYLGAAIAFAGNVALARLLGPDDFGVYAFVSSILTIIFMISAFGSQEAIVQCREGDLPHLIPTAFWMTIGLGLLLAGIGTLAGVVLLPMQGSTAGLLLVALSWMNFLGMLGNTYMAILKRELRYKPIAILGTAATIVSFGAAILVAFYGGGVWSLFVREAVQTFLTLAGAICVTGYRLPLALSRKAALWIWKFGLRIMGSGMTENLTTSLDKLAVGSFLGTVALGYYSLAHRLTILGHQFSQGVIASVSLSTYASIQKDVNRVRTAFERLYYWLFRLTLVMGVVIWLGGKQLVLWVYGTQWTVAGELFQNLTILLVMMPLVNALKVLLIGSGNVDKALRALVLRTVFFVLAVFFAAYTLKNVIAVAWAVNLSMILVWVLMMVYVNSVVQVDWKYLMVKPLIVGVVSFGMGSLTGFMWNMDGILQAVLGGVLFSVIMVVWEQRELKFEWGMIRAQFSAGAVQGQGGTV